ncbi:MAG: HEPN domain-containing protein [Phycisphaeraceae bacterium]
MLPTTQEWVAKAEADYDVVCLLLKSRKRSRYDPICFHAQQCVEKYLKARLNESGVPFTKTHDLVLLLHSTVTIEPAWISYLNPMKALTISAVAPRYPGMNATVVHARSAAKLCRQFREEARRSLGV